MYKILLIEDDETIVKELSEVLRRQGYACCVWNLMEDMQLLLQREAVSYTHLTLPTN